MLHESQLKKLPPKTRSALALFNCVQSHYNVLRQYEVQTNRGSWHNASGQQPVLCYRGRGDSEPYGRTSPSDKDARALCDLYDNIIIMLWSANDRQVTRVMCIYTAPAISVLYCVCE